MYIKDVYKDDIMNYMEYEIRLEDIKSVLMIIPRHQQGEYDHY